jgi:small-conductance mechanosensitive channel
MHLSWLRLGVAVLALLACVAGSGGAVSAESADKGSIVITLPPDLDPAARDALVRSLEGLNAPIAVEAPTTAAEPAAAESEFATAIGRLDDALYGVVKLPGVLATWWSALGGGFASVLAVLAMLAAIAIGFVVEWGLDRLLAGRRRGILEASPSRFPARLGYALAWFALELLGVAAFGIGTFLGGWLVVPSTPAVLTSFGVILIAIVEVRFYLLLAQLLFASHHSNMRLIPMADAAASAVWRWLVILILVPAAFRAMLSILVETEGLTRAAGFVGLLTAVVLLATRLAAFLGTRRQIRALIREGYARPDGVVPGPARLFAETWHILFAGFAVLAFLVEVYGLLSLQVHGVGSIGGLAYLIFLPFVLKAWAALIQELMIEGAGGTRRAVLGGIIQTLGQGVILIMTFAGVARVLGADPFAVQGGIEDRIAAALFKASAAILIGWALWNGARILLEQYASKAEGGEISEEGMGKEGSRIETLVPVIRNFLFVTIIVIAGMTALSALGVQIAPLLAGAGVIGLAIGFGAQTLVSDVITGLFYLIEDAFRKGEYIECDAGKGVVEKMSIRSLQLRHHRGPLYTIAFSKMGNVVNHSRDWVKIKFLLRVPFDTDLEKVRKVIKKVGQELAEHPDLGDLFLQPLKSQGVTDVDDSAFIIGVKFVCRPGEQFMIRREAYARIKQAFVQNGIEFASRRVTVDTQSGGEGSAAAAAAALAPPGAAKAS